MSDFVTISLTRGQFTKVDSEDAEAVRKWKWSAQPARSTGGGVCGFYAVRSYKGSTVYLHRTIMEAGPGQQIDHANGDKLDNRKANLRFCTASENIANRAHKPSPTGYRGVAATPSGKFEAALVFSKKRVLQKVFLTAEEAAKAYDQAARKYFGEFAVTNFPEAST